MSAPGASAGFAAAYASGLVDYLRDPGEASLSVAYELGREAVTRRLSVLELAVVHQRAVTSLLEQSSGEDGVAELTRAAGDYFLESLASFEMVQRGLDEARDVVWRHQRRTELSRRLSTFLTDASLALDVRGSLPEVLRLVCEQARELTDAECCLTTVSLGDRPGAVKAASHVEPEPRWRALERWLDPVAIDELIRDRGGSVRLGVQELAALPQLRGPSADRPLTGWLAAALTALDGSELGAIQLFDTRDGGFTPDDQAALMHLAQVVSAALERTRLYEGRE